MPRLKKIDRPKALQKKLEKNYDDLQKAEKKFDNCKSTFDKNVKKFNKREETLMGGKLRPGHAYAPRKQKVPPKPPRVKPKKKMTGAERTAKARAALAAKRAAKRAAVRPLVS